MTIPKFSIIVTTYSRYKRLELVLSSWFKAGADEVILANGGKWFKTKLPIKQFFFRPDPGNKIRFAAATLAANDMIVLADDDVLVKPGIFQDFLKCYKKNNGIYGIIGRKSGGKTYWECPFIRADKIAYPIEVFFCGVIYFTHRCRLPVDLSCIKNRAYDDLYWHMVAQKDTPKYVFPTKNYENMKPECNDPNSIFKTPASKEARNKFYQEHK